MWPFIKEIALKKLNLYKLKDMDLAKMFQKSLMK